MGSIVFYRSALIEFVVISDKQLRFDEHCHTSNIVLTAIVNDHTSPVSVLPDHYALKPTVLRSL